MALAKDDYTAFYAKQTTIALLPVEGLAGIDLLTLFDAYEAAQGALLSVFNMPRAEGVTANIIEKERARRDHAMDRIADVALRKLMADEGDEAYAAIVVRRAVALGDWPEAMKATAILVASKLEG